MTDGEWVADRRRWAPSPSSPRPAARTDDQAGASSYDSVADRAGDLAAGLVSLGFIGEALRRSRRLWVGLALVGLLLGVAVSAARPAAPQATTTLLLTVGPESQPGTAILNEQSMAQTRGVAAIAVRRLGLKESADALLGTYTATVVTDRVLRITASAPSSGQAVRRANVLAEAFLAFRAEQLQTQQDLQFAAFDGVVARSEQQLASVIARTKQVAAQPTSVSQQARLRALRSATDRAQAELDVLKTQVNAARASAEETTAAMVGQSRVLDSAIPVLHSRIKPIVLFGGAGLVIGIALGIGLVIVRAIVSDRLRRRDDVAAALGAPVRLSVPRGRAGRLRPRRRGLAAAQRGDVRRIAAFLRGMVPSDAHASLAVVPVDDTRTAALSVISLAATIAQQDGIRVVVADLCQDTPVAKLVGRTAPGLHAVPVDTAQIEVAVFEPTEIAPVGPFHPDQHLVVDETSAACASADVLLTLTTLDPSLAGDHLGTWASDAVVMVTAGRSSWTRIHAVSEMIQLAGARLVAGVLIGADKWDESLGVIAPRAAGRHAAAGDNGTTDGGPFGATALSRRPGVSGGSNSP